MVRELLLGLTAALVAVMMIIVVRLAADSLKRRNGGGTGCGSYRLPMNDSGVVVVRHRARYRVL